MPPVSQLLASVWLDAFHLSIDNTGSPNGKWWKWHRHLETRMRSFPSLCLSLVAQTPQEIQDNCPPTPALPIINETTELNIYIFDASRASFAQDNAKTVGNTTLPH
jgi:hypothetical protein